MTDEQPQRPQITPDELHAATGSSFGLVIGRLTVDNLELRSLLAAAQKRIVQAAAERQDLQDEVSRLTAGAVAYEGRIDQLEKELAARPTPEQVADLNAQIDQLIEAGPTVAQSAARDLAKAEA
jgi:predicted  nucleic acid-binding Zn-ribbon protein